VHLLSSVLRQYYSALRHVAVPSTSTASTSPSPPPTNSSNTVYRTSSFPLAAVVVPTVVVCIMCILLVLVIYFLWRRTRNGEAYHPSPAVHQMSNIGYPSQALASEMFIPSQNPAPAQTNSQLQDIPFSPAQVPRNISSVEHGSIVPPQYKPIQSEMLAPRWEAPAPGSSSSPNQ